MCIGNFLFNDCDILTGKVCQAVSDGKQDSCLDCAGDLKLWLNDVNVSTKRVRSFRASMLLSKELHE